MTSRRLDEQSRPRRVLDDHHAEQACEPGVRSALGLEALAVGLQIGVDHRQPRRRRRWRRGRSHGPGRLIPLVRLGEVRQRQVVAADQRPDECPSLQGPDESGLRVPRDESFGVEQGAGP